jgi:hypothetical protein
LTARSLIGRTGRRQRVGRRFLWHNRNAGHFTRIRCLEPSEAGVDEDADSVTDLIAERNLIPGRN